MLDPQKHQRQNFSCGEVSLDEWLLRYSKQNRRGTAATWVIADAQGCVVAYATLSMTAIDSSAAPRILAKGAPKVIPALLVGRLAVDRSVAGHGLGTELVKHILKTAVELNLKAACRAVVVTALNESARQWWQRFGFSLFAEGDPNNFDLYCLLVAFRSH